MQPLAIANSSARAAAVAYARSQLKVSRISNEKAKFEEAQQELVDALRRVQAAAPKLASATGVGALLRKVNAKKLTKDEEEVKRCVIS